MNSPFEYQEEFHSVSVTVNGEEMIRSIPARLLLSDFLRGELALTGTHVGCEQGHCGCCTVLIDGLAVRSCLTLAVQVDHSSIITIESVAKGNDLLHPIQQAFIDNHAFQCGFCTPGIIMGLLEYYQQGGNGVLSDKEIRGLLAGHLCRCTGYQQMVEAVRDVIASLQES
jgi:carbon-monoxide dehydrogenase small subunit